MKGRIAAAAVIASALTAGCIPMPPQSSGPRIASYTPPGPTPTCKSQKQCEAMWIEAQEAIQALTLMKLQYVSDGRMETYNPTGAGRLGGSVVKAPIDSKTYEIRASLSCYRYVDCSDVASMGVSLFNRRVTAAGAPFEETAQPEKAADVAPATEAAPTGPRTRKPNKTAKKT